MSSKEVEMFITGYQDQNITCWSEGYDEGYEQGYEQGYDAGYDMSEYDDGYKDGEEEGYKKAVREMRIKEVISKYEKELIQK